MRSFREKEMRRNRKWILVTIPFISLIAIESSYGQAFYKWVDGNGVMQYTQTPPPPQHVLNKVAASTPAQQDRMLEIKKRNEQSRKSQNLSTAEEQAAESARKNAEADADFRNRNRAECQQLKLNLAQLKSGQRFRTIDGNGDRSYLTEEQKAAQIKQQTAQIQNYCP